MFIKVQKKLIKTIDKMTKILYYIYNLEKRWLAISIIVEIFFISFCINILIIFYSIYSTFEFLFMQNLQGSKLNYKKKFLENEKN